jgi:prepilin-type N-terminal cleavage/methylation domain-containing protein/prepilin-type processing-associated H-X9-DG protein
MKSVTRAIRPSIITRRGLTLVELLATIAIIGLIVALLLPAVQSARESARRTSCANRMRQVGLSLNAFMSGHGTLPAGSSWPHNTQGVLRLIANQEIRQASGGVPNSPWNWISQLLPHLGQSNAYDRLDFNTGWSSGTNLTVARTPFPEMICPSDPRASSSPLFGDANSMATWYVGCYGPTSVDCYSPFAAFDTPFCDSANSSWCRHHAHNDNVTSGVFGRVWRALSVARIRDGMSTTIAVGETLPYDWRNYATMFKPNNPMGTLAIPLNQPRTQGAQDIGGGIVNTVYDMCETAGFKSAHPGAVNFVFCDGSVRTISDSIDFRTQCALGTYCGSAQPSSSRRDAVMVSHTDF